MTRLSKMLVAYEQKHDLPAQSVADQIGLNKSTYSRIKNGGIPDAQNFIRVMSWMLEGDPE